MGLSICVDPSRNVFASGAYRSASSFGSTTLGKWNHTDIYVTKIRQANNASPANTAMIIDGNDTLTSEPTIVTESKNTVSTILETEKDSSLFVKVFPNPNNGLFTLEINMANTTVAEQIKIELINTVGQIVYQKLVSSNDGYINEHVELESTIPIGVYFLKITVGNKIETSQLILTK